MPWLPTLQQQRAQHRDGGERDHERGDHADDGGDGDGAEQATLDAGQAQQRKQHQDDQDGGVEDRVAHLAGGRGDDFQLRQRLRQRGIYLEPAEDVLDIDDRVIDDHADGHGEAAEGHAVDTESGKFEGDAG